MSANKPIAEACLRNQQPIADTLAKVFVNPANILELGSGTGQHAVAVAERLPHLTWQPTDLPDCLPGINAWREDAGLTNILQPVALDVTQSPWPVSGPFDGVFTANTVHFVGWKIVSAMFAGVSSHLKVDGIFCIYGPFNLDGEYTSEGNMRLDQWLKGRDPDSGIKDLSSVRERAAEVGLIFEDKFTMPANNMMLRFTRQTI